MSANTDRRAREYRQRRAEYLHNHDRFADLKAEGLEHLVPLRAVGCDDRAGLELRGRATAKPPQRIPVGRRL